MKFKWFIWLGALSVFAESPDVGPRLRVAWKDDYLTISGPNLPGGEMRVHYLEAYCRAGSTKRPWGRR